jgi:hypothetical protein
VISAIDLDLDHEPRCRCREISNEPPERHLPPKPHPELSAAKQSPERLLRGSEGRAHGDGAPDDESLVGPGILR